MKIALDDVDAINLSAERAADLIALDDALTALAEFDLQKSRMVELRYFAGLSVASVIAGRLIYRGRSGEPADNPYLNRRQLGFVGRSFKLDEPIVNGRGRLTIEDTIWEIEGPDAAPGTMVKVTAVTGMRLIMVGARRGESVAKSMRCIAARLSSLSPTGTACAGISRNAIFPPSSA